MAMVAMGTPFSNESSRSLAGLGRRGRRGDLRVLQDEVAQVCRLELRAPGPLPDLVLDGELQRVVAEGGSLRRGDEPFEADDDRMTSGTGGQLERRHHGDAAIDLGLDLPLSCSVGGRAGDSLGACFGAGDVGRTRGVTAASRDADRSDGANAGEDEWVTGQAELAHGGCPFLRGTVVARGIASTGVDLNYRDVAESRGY